PTTCASSQIERALQRGRRSAHPFAWLLSSPQQPLETEDPPTVSLAPQYTSQHLCRAIVIFSRAETIANQQYCQQMSGSRGFRGNIFHSSQGKIFPSVATCRQRQPLHDAHEPSTPSSALIASASALACALTSSSFSPSIMIRANGSVPE